MFERERERRRAGERDRDRDRERQAHTHPLLGVAVCEEVVNFGEIPLNNNNNHFPKQQEV